jgi:hypothetical protein
MALAWSKTYEYVRQSVLQNLQTRSQELQQCPPLQKSIVHLHEFLQSSEFELMAELA